MAKVKRKTATTIAAAVAIAAALTAAFFFTDGPSEKKNREAALIQSTVSAIESNSYADVSAAVPAQSSTEKSVSRSTSEKEPSGSSFTSDADLSSYAQETSAEEEQQESVNASPENSLQESFSEEQSQNSYRQDTDISDTEAQELSEPLSEVQYSSKNAPESSAASESTEPQVTSDETVQQCTFSISCSALLDNMDSLKKNKRPLVPPDGVILSPEKYELADGESVFGLSKRICRERRIPFEFTVTPIYNTAYIEGIYNLYEFDCGSGSGWIYTVNGEKPSVGCSDFRLKNGDIVEWHYTCALGNDIPESVSREAPQ